MGPDPRSEEEASEQPTAPYLDAVVAYAFRGTARYHVPGHKGGPGADPGLRKAIGLDALAADVPQDIHGIDLGPSPTPYERAERLAAEAYGAARSWFLTNGATQGNHALCLALAPLGTRIVAQRNSHASIVDGLVLSGGLPSFVAPEYDDERGITHCVTPEALEAALRDAPDAKAAFIVSPTYFGMAADIAGCAEVAHAAGVPLVVDQSWGPHFGFNEALPPTALSQGADAMLTSTHKIAGSLTQSAMLHVGHGALVDAGAVARALRLLRSTSPSSLLLASLDGARRQLALHGEQLLLRDARGDRRRAREARDDRRHRSSSTRRSSARWAWPATTRCGSCSTCAAPGAPATRSPTRCAAPTTSTSSCRCRRRSSSSSASASPSRRCGAWPATSRRPSSASPSRAPPRRSSRPVTSLRNEVALPPREAFLGAAEQVAVDDAVGRISCESIASYPPGVPALLPGERISAETVAYLRELAGSGARLHGASDPAFQTINVLRGSPMIDPLERWAQYGEKPDYAGLLTFCGVPYTQDPAELAGFDVAVVGAPMDDLVSDRPGARLAPRAIRGASCPPGPHLEVKIDAFERLRVVDFGDAPVHPGRRLRLPRRDRGDRRPGARRGRAARSSSAATTRSPSPPCARARRRTGRSAWCTSTPTRTPAPRCSASSAPTGRSSAA